MTVRVWDVSTKSEVARMEQGRADDVKCCAWSPDGARLASASWDGTVRVWLAAARVPSTTRAGPSDAQERATRAAAAPAAAAAAVTAAAAGIDAAVAAAARPPPLPPTFTPAAAATAARPIPLPLTTAPAATARDNHGNHGNSLAAAAAAHGKPAMKVQMCRNFP